MKDSIAKRVRIAIEAEDVALTDDQRQCLVDGIVSELQPELDKLREANRERGRISTRLYLARLESKETQSRLQRGDGPQRQLKRPALAADPEAAS